MELLIFLLPPLIKAKYDAKNGNTKHLKSMLINGFFILGIALLLDVADCNPIIPWWAYLVTGLSIQWIIFDYLYNAIKGHPWDYIGDPKYHADDIFFKPYQHLGGYIIAFFKLWFLVTGLALYFQFDLL